MTRVSSLLAVLCLFTIMATAAALGGETERPQLRPKLLILLLEIRRRGVRELAALLRRASPAVGHQAGSSTSR